jgi:radical SAM protein with 4Fe4S-binding SPASM domain
VKEFIRKLKLKGRIRRLMKTDELIAPSHLAIETTNNCSAVCEFCPSSTQTRPRGVMNMELFKRIIVDAKECGSVDFITHGGMGEPLLDETIVDKVIFEKSQLNAVIQMHTNASFLDEKTTSDLYDSGLDVLSISLNAFQSRTHKNITGLDYDTVRANVERAFEIKSKKNSTTDIRITIVRTDSAPAEEIEEFVDFWNQFTPIIAIHPAKNWGDWRPNRLRGEKYPCKWIWNTMSVNWDGTVSICHEDYDAKFVIGNIGDSKILDIFNCPELKQLRIIFSENGFPENSLCKDCSRLYLDRKFWAKANFKKVTSGAIAYSYSGKR